MTELSPDARALIEQARRQGPGLMGPSARDRARLREKLAPGWSQTPEPQKPPFAWPYKRHAVSSFVLIAGLSWLGWYLLSPPTSDSALPAEGPPPPAASADAPAVAAATEPLAASAAGSPDVERAQEHGNSMQPGHVPAPAKRAVGSNGRARTAAPGKSQNDARDRATLPASAANAAEPTQPRTTSGEHRDRDLDQAARADDTSRSSGAEGSSRSEAQAERNNDAAARGAQAPEEASPLTATAADGRTHAVRTDSRPGPRSIEGELELLGEAQAALQAQRPSRALNLLQEHAFRFPAGALLDERMAMQALALCALDRKNAAASVLSSLEARGSRSALLPRVRRQCGL